MTYVINSNDLGLRYFQEADIGIFLEYRNDPAIAKYQSWNFPFTPQDGLEFFLSMQSVSIYSSDHWLQLIIEDQSTQTIIGDCAYRVSGHEAEIGITIRSEFQNQGYATRGLILLFNLLFHKLKLHRVVAILDVENVGSMKLMEKLGMRREAHCLESFFDKKTDSWKDEYIYAILEKEYADPSP